MGRLNDINLQLILCECFSSNLFATFLSSGISVRGHEVSVKIKLKKKQQYISYLISLAVVCEVIKLKSLEIVTHLCFRLLADLNSPMYVPETISLDRKHILEDIESKYRDFITSTLRCLSELKRELCECLTGVTLFTCLATNEKGPAFTPLAGSAFQKVCAEMVISDNQPFVMSQRDLTS